MHMYKGRRGMYGRRTAAREIPEKTLELNVTAEILQAVRQRFPSAFAFGPSLREEAYLGYDVAVRVWVFQFKAPLADHPPDTFTLNAKQQEALLHSAMPGQVPSRAYYALPPFRRFAELNRYAPNLLPTVHFLDVRDVGQLADPPERHRVLVDQGRVVIHRSPYTELKLLRWGDLENALDMEAALKRDKSQWHRDLTKEHRIVLAQAARKLRGLRLTRGLRFVSLSEKEGAQ